MSSQGLLKIRIADSDQETNLNSCLGKLSNAALEGSVKTRVARLLAIIFLLALNGYAQVPGPLKLIHTISLPGLKDGYFEHFQVDLTGMRLFLAAEDNAVIEVINLRTNKVVHEIAGLKKPHSMAYDPNSNKLFVVDESQVEIYDGSSYQLVRTTAMGAHADTSVYDGVNHLYYVGNGGRQQNEDFLNISILDTNGGTRVGDIRVDADRVEAMAIEKSGPRMFANLYSRAAVAVIDRVKKNVIATWSISQEGRTNVSMAFDEADHRLFVHARDPGKVVVIDSDSGKIITTLPSVSMVDDMTYDAKLGLLYVTGVPLINIFQRRDPDRYDLIGQVPTAFHAVTSILVPQLNRFYLAVNHHGDTSAVVQVYQVMP